MSQDTKCPLAFSIVPIIMTRRRHKYELIENASGRTLTSGVTPEQALANAAQYMRDYNLSPSDVTYLIIRNGAKAEVAFRATGDDLRELLEDEEDALTEAATADETDPYYDISEEWYE